MDTGVAVVAGLVLAVIAFRRARGVLHPEARREATRQAIRSSSGGTRTRRALTAVLSVARAAVGVAALVGVVWLTRKLFR